MIGTTPEPRRKRMVIRCDYCEAEIKEEALFCPVCGSRAPRSRRNTPMRYHTIALNEYGKAKVCPHCENDEPTPGNFCKICGSDIVNRCGDMPNPKNRRETLPGCGQTLQGNARYCSLCGHESTFFQKGWLKDWKSENIKKAIRNVNVTIDFQELKEREEENA